MSTVWDELEQTDVLEVSSRFRAMNTDIELIIFTHDVEKATQSCHQVETIFAGVEDILSRFRPESELCKLNRSGYLKNATTTLYQNIEEAQKMTEITGGIFNPTIITALEAAGYDRSFEKIFRPARSEPQLFNGPQTSLPFQNNWRKIELDQKTQSIRLPFGTRIDLGGIAKGSTVDRAAKFLRQAGFVNFMLSAGGDMWLQGCPPQDINGWTVGIENPLTLPELAVLDTLTITNKAVATSSTMGRRWSVNNQIRHHLIDPRTGEPTKNGVAAVTAVAKTVQLADVLAKTALILGPEEAKKNLCQIEGLNSLLFVTIEGEIVRI